MNHHARTITVVFLAFFLPACACLNIQIRDYFNFTDLPEPQQRFADNFIDILDTMWENVLNNISESVKELNEVDPNTWLTQVPDMGECSTHRLTSPRDGLPNGMATIYWDPVPSATSFIIEIYSQMQLIGYWTAEAGATNITVDVSHAAIGGENPFTLNVHAVLVRNRCTDAITLDREAPPRQAPIIPTEAPTARPLPTATPDCEADPYSPYC